MSKIFLISFLLFIPFFVSAVEGSYETYEDCFSAECASIEGCELDASSTEACGLCKTDCETAVAASDEIEADEAAADPTTPTTTSTPTTSTPAQGTTATVTTTLDNPLKAQGDNPVAIIGNIIRAMLGVVGAVTLLMFLYGGFMLIFSAGEQEKLEKGRKTLVWAVIGLAIVLSSYSILSYVFKILVTAT